MDGLITFFTVSGNPCIIADQEEKILFGVPLSFYFNISGLHIVTETFIGCISLETKSSFTFFLLPNHTHIWQTFMIDKQENTLDAWCALDNTNI